MVLKSVNIQIAKAFLGITGERGKVIIIHEKVVVLKSKRQHKSKILVTSHI